MDDDFLRDLFGSVGPIAVRRMFGGKGIFADGMMIALLAFDDVFVKADTETEDLFRSAGSRPFQYRRAVRAVKVPAFWSLPEAALDDPELAAVWARRGYEAASRSAARAGARRSRPTGAARASTRPDGDAERLPGHKDP